ncbi:PilN domain-containing protein [Candidatus Roizmanbacteria bacterium]|nr:PilN domain-containing protein [Candidatus Roizmanbacteria bacterium]
MKVNLLPKEELEKKPLGKFLRWVLSYGRYIIISVELVVFLVFFSRFIYDRQLSDLNDAIEQKQAIVASAQEFETKIRDIQYKITQIKSLEENRFMYLDIIDTLKTITPKEVVLTNIEINETGLTIQGEAVTNEGFAYFLNVIKQDKLFEKITLEQLEKRPEDNVIEFTAAVSFPPTQKPQALVTPAVQPDTPVEESGI